MENSGTSPSLAAAASRALRKDFASKLDHGGLGEWASVFSVLALSYTQPY